MEDNNVLYLSLDEHGNFDDPNDDSKFIAGLIYKSDKDEVLIEQKRISAYYQMLVKDAGKTFKYPDDLHSSSVEDVLKKSLPEFILKGTYKGKEINKCNNFDLAKRKGRYYLFIMIKSAKGKSVYLDANTSEVINDNYASNLYFHMASSVVNRVICHNPLFALNEDLNFYIDLPSKLTSDVTSLGLKKKDYEKAGYSQVMSTNENTSKEEYYKGYKYSVTNKDIYRTLIINELTENKKTNVKVDYFNVRSIDFNNPNKNQEFLFLADSICLYLKDYVANDDIDEIYKEINILNNKGNNLVYAYDDVDDYYKKAYTSYENGELFEALANIYDGKQINSSVSKYYDKHLFSDLISKILNNVNVPNFKKSVSSLSKNIKINNLDQSKLVFLLKHIEKMENRVIDKLAHDDAIRTKFEINNFALSAYCHVGKPSVAAKYYLKCLESAEYVTFDQIIDIRRKYGECLTDSFMFDEAYKMAGDNKKYYENLLVARDSLLSSINKKEDFIADLADETNKTKLSNKCFEYAKTVSNLGRALAYKKNKKAIDEFKLALKMMDEKDANYKITQSYLLHFYGDNKMLEEFEKEATLYFEGNKSYKDRFNYIKKELKNEADLYSMGFMLFIFVRGLYLSKTNEVKASDIVSLINKIEESGKASTKNFPWPVIYKYLALLDKDNYEFYLDNVLNSATYNSKTLYAVTLFQLTEVYKEVNNEGMFEKTLDQLKKHLKDNFEVFKEMEFSSDSKESYKLLSKYFTYMLR